MSDTEPRPSELLAAERALERAFDETGILRDPDELTPEVLAALNDDQARARIDAGLADADAGRTIPLEDL